MKNHNDKIKINFELDIDLDRLVEFIKLKYMCPKKEAINIIVRLYSETQEGKVLLGFLDANNNSSNNNKPLVFGHSDGAEPE